MAGELRWRYSHGRHYYEDDKYGWAYIDRRDGEFWASNRKSIATFTTLREAKAWVEKNTTASPKRSNDG